MLFDLGIFHEYGIGASQQELAGSSPVPLPVIFGDRDTVLGETARRVESDQAAT